MNATSENLRATFNSFLGGSTNRYRHVFNRSFIYTEGVKAVAEEAGAYWLIDVVATELAPLLRKLDEDAILKFNVIDGVGELTASTKDSAPPVWTKRVPYTDFPTGEWVFEIAHDWVVDQSQASIVMLLLTEH